MSAFSFVDASGLKAWLADGQEIALLDVREAGEFAEGHPLFASSVPLGLFELDLLRLVPRRSTRLVLLDDGKSGRSQRAGSWAEELGYTDVHVLAGGAQAWAAEGFTLFEGQFVPSKAFGEIAEDAYGVPHVSAGTLAAWQAEGVPLLILDGRPFDEHRKMNIPGSICLPNGEIPYRIDRILPDDTTPIIVHCAGRTRSIVGAQILREHGIANPVYALENGTQGWTLAGLPLEKGSARRVVDVPDASGRDALAASARDVAARWGLPLLNAEEAALLLADGNRTTYLFDVRSQDEFLSGTVPGAVHAPGGQLIQATDLWAAVRGARIILIDDTGIRAATVGRWLQAMGWECHLLAGDIMAWSDLQAPVMPDPIADVPDLLGPVPDGAVILDVRGSTAFRSGHIAGALWCLRARLPDIAATLDTSACVVLCGDRAHARTIAHDLTRGGVRQVMFMDGTPDDWRRRGYEIVATPSSPSDAEAIDFVFFVHDRHNGNLDAARRYLAWETGLVERLDADERAAFSLGSPRSRVRSP